MQSEASTYTTLAMWSVSGATEGLDPKLLSQCKEVYLYIEKLELNDVTFGDLREAVGLRYERERGLVLLVSWSKSLQQGGGGIQEREGTSDKTGVGRTKDDGAATVQRKPPGTPRRRTRHPRQP